MKPVIKGRRMFSLLLGLFASPVLLSAQNLTGEIDGVVHDETGAAIPHAVLTVANVAEHVVVRKQETDDQGEFVVPALTTGSYQITVEAVGFKTESVTKIAVDVDRQTPIQIVLHLGENSETLTVTANAIGPETRSAASGTLIDGAQVQELSLSSRNYQQLLSVQPGITGPIPGAIDRGNISTTGKTNSATFSVNGQQDQQNAYFLDGEDLLNHGGSWQTASFPSIDAIQEMNLLRNSYGAQYGGGGSGIVAMQTRFGTSKFHGGAFEFFRSEVLNANTYFNNLAEVQRPAIRYNDYGYSLGGPVWIPHLLNRREPRTFFFFMQDFLREETETLDTITNVPTAAQRQGIFSAPICTTYANSKCTETATTIRSIDPTAQAYLTDILNKLPVPNNPLDPQGLIHPNAGINNESQTVIRIDRQIGKNWSLFFRYLDDPFHLVVPYGIYGSAGLPGVKTADVTDGGTDYLGHSTYSLNDETIVEWGFAYSPLWITANPIGLEASANSPDIHPTMPYTSVLDRVPDVSINGFAVTGGTGGVYNNIGSNTQIFLNLIHSIGRHVLTVGGSYEDEASGNNTATTNAGSFTFTAGAIPTGGASRFMQAFASFLSGQVNTFTQSSINAAFQVHTHVFDGYIQDDYRVRPRLTINGGVRYSFIQQPYSAPFMEQNLSLTNFRPASYSAGNTPTIGNTGLICTQAPCPGGETPNTAYNPLNGIIVGGATSPYGKAVSSQPDLNFAPRAGLAWDVRGDGRTSVRAGYGVYFIQPFMNAVQTQTNQPPDVATTTNSNTSFDDIGGQLTSQTPLTLAARQTNWVTPYTQSWSLDVQREIGGTAVLDVGYYGDRVLHLIGTFNINQPRPGTYVETGIIPGNLVTSTNDVYLNQIRPYLGWGAINSESPVFSSNYDALQTSVRKQFHDGSMLAMNYTFSKALANTAQDYQSAPMNSSNIAAEYGPTSSNRKSVLSVDYVYALPFFEDQHGIIGHVLGGWEGTGIISYGSGQPFTATTSGVDPGGIGSTSGYPDTLSNPNQGAPHALAQWFNTTAFANVPNGVYRSGNEQRGSIVGPGYETWDLSLFKNVHLFDLPVVQVRAESFNAFNHTNWTTVSTSLTATNYGQVTASGQARILQLATKVNF